jgi:hypothetical protein
MAPTHSAARLRAISPLDVIRSIETSETSHTMRDGAAMRLARQIDEA